MPANNYFKSKFFGSKYQGSRYYRPPGTSVEEVYKPEGGPSDGDYILHEDDEVIMLVARAFLTMVN
jgi:hypothetical protein